MLSAGLSCAVRTSFVSSLLASLTFFTPSLASVQSLVFDAPLVDGMVVDDRVGRGLAGSPGAVRMSFVSSFSALLTSCRCFLAAVGGAAVGLGEAGRRLTVRDRDGAAFSVDSSGVIGTFSGFLSPFL